ncbi:hypothetical protein FRB99_004295 [Tulasnella sp. 403]|nr:hypothetical protein FRB99_004295 [Tulasnella sp. 403]
MALLNVVRVVLLGLSQSSQSALSLTRDVSTAFSVLLSLIVAAIFFNFVALANTVKTTTAYWIGIGVAAFTATHILLGWILEAFQRRAYTCVVWFDLVRTVVTCGLWLATSVAITLLGRIDNCIPPPADIDGFVPYGLSSTDHALCSLFHLAQASSWIVFIFSFSWFAILLACSIIAHRGGRKDVWTLTVKEHPLSTKNSSPDPETRPTSYTGSDAKSRNGRDYIPSAYGMLVSSYSYRNSLVASQIPELERAPSNLTVSSTTTRKDSNHP